MCNVSVISKELIEKWKQYDPFVGGLVNIIERDEEVKALLEMSNINAVGRLGYNDHGPVHAKIVAGTSLEILGLLLKKNVELTTLKQGTAKYNELLRIEEYLGTRAKYPGLEAFKHYKR